MSAGYSEKVYVTRAIEEVRWSLLVVLSFTIHLSSINYYTIDLMAVKDDPHISLEF